MVTQDDVPPAFRRRPEAWLEQPLNPERVGELSALQVFDAWEARPVEWERNLREPGYRLPKIWNISADGISARVHASRVLLFRGAKRSTSQMRWGRTGNGMPDNSVLQAVWDEIQRLTSTMQGGAVLAQELSESVIKVEQMPAKTTGDEASAFRTLLARFAMAKGLLNMIVLGKNDSYERKATPATGFKDLSEGAQAMLATVLGWPRSMLSGEAPSGLSTDDAAGLERERKIVSTYQEQRLRRPLEQFYGVLYASQDGPTRGITPEEWALEFAPLNEPSAQETAELRLTTAKMDEINVRLGAYGGEQVAADRFGAEGWSLDLQEVPIPDPDEEAAIAAAAAELDPGAGGVGIPTPRPGARADDAPTLDSVYILVPAADPELRSAVEAAIGQRLAPEESPHVTVLYVGSLDPDALAELTATVTDEASRAMPGTLGAGSVRAFPAGPDGVPIVVEFGDAWALQGLHDVLLTRLAHLISARQHRSFRAHITLGFAPAPLSAAALGALAGIDASGVRVPISAVVVQVGNEVVATITVGS
jgi:phage-related protein (TIGR01555 family)